MKIKKYVSVILAIFTALSSILLSSCATPTLTDFFNKDADSEAPPTSGTATYAECTAAVKEWLPTLADYAHREYRTGESVDDINILYLGFQYCLRHFKSIDEIIFSGS